MGKKKDKAAKDAHADPPVTDSINPFEDLPAAPPTAAPSIVDEKRKSLNKKDEIPPAAKTNLEGMPPMGGKPGWRRVSTRQWIRDFRDHIGKFQTYPYKPVCGKFFWSFGYYPDMVPQDSYQKYVEKHPIATRRHSTGSGQDVETESDMNLTSTTAVSSMSKMTTDDNMNLPPLLPPLPDKKGKTDKAEEPPPEVAHKHKKKGEKSDEGVAAAKKGEAGEAVAGAVAAAAADGDEVEHGHKKGKKGKKSTHEEGITTADGDEVEHGHKKGKKGKKSTHEEGITTAEESGEEGGHKVKKGKKGKGAAEGEDEHPADAEAHPKHKKKKGEVMPASAISGNLSFDPAVYDLTTLTVMNLPAGADAKSLHKLFHGGKVTLDGGAATVKFKDASLAEPFFTKDIALDGQILVISPKLKT